MSTQPILPEEYIEPPILNEADLTLLPNRCLTCPVVLHLLEKAEAIEKSNLDANPTSTTVSNAFRRHAKYVLEHCSDGIDETTKDKLFGQSVVSVSCQSTTAQKLPAHMRTATYRIK